MRYLASIENRYLSTYEDIVIVINTKLISEILIGLEMNLLNRSRNEGIEFSFTGMGALVQDEEIYEINYEELF